MAYVGNKVFISYRGKYYQQARMLAQDLLDLRYCREVILIPPEMLSKSNEVLLPFEFFELMEFITDSMHDCDALALLDAGDYWNSYWTQVEIQQWRRFSKSAEAYVAKLDAQNRAAIQGKVRLAPLDEHEARLLARVSVGTNRRMLQSSRLPAAWGKFAKNCFLVPCASCGRHFLATQKAVYASINQRFNVLCPHCGNESQFVEDSAFGNFYRKPVLIKGKLSGIRPLNGADLLNLLVTGDAPPELGLVSLPGETLDSDLVKVLKAYGWVAGAVAVAGALLWLFGGDEDA